MMNLDFLSAHKHYISYIKQINPVKSMPLSFMTWILGHTQLISLSLSIQIEIFLHPFYFIDGVEGHLQLLYLILSYAHGLGW